MPNLANNIRSYIAARLFGHGEPHLRRANAVLPSFQPVGLQEFLALEVPPTRNVARSDFAGAKPRDAVCPKGDWKKLAWALDCSDGCKRRVVASLERAQGAPCSIR